MADFLDPSTGTKLTPSYEGKECLGNGSWPGYECCCDECDFYQICFPPSHYGDRRDFWRPIVRDDTCMECKHRDRKTENKPKIFCNKTKRWGRELRGNRCPHFEMEDISMFDKNEIRQKVDNLLAEYQNDKAAAYAHVCNSMTSPNPDPEMVAIKRELEDRITAEVMAGMGWDRTDAGLWKKEV